MSSGLSTETRANANQQEEPLNNIFISYSRKDKVFGEKIHLYLASHKHDVWRDEEDLPPIAKVWDEIEEAIQTRDNFIFIMSPQCLLSPSCHHELHLARTFPKRIIPILLTHFKRDTVLRALKKKNTSLSTFEKTLYKGRALEEVADENLTYLANINWIDFTIPAEFDKQCDVLARTLSTDLDYVKLHTRYLVRAGEWQQNQFHPKRLLRGKERIEAKKLLRYPASNKPPVTALQKDFIAKSRCAEVTEWLEKRHKERLIRDNKRWFRMALLGTIVFLVAAILATAQAQSAVRRKKLADASYERTIGSNLYLTGSFLKARQHYEGALNALQQLESGLTSNWSRFATAEYKNENIHVEEWLYNLAQACVQLQKPDFQCAIDNLQAALQVNPGYTDAGLALTDVYSEQGMIAEAQSALQNVYDNASQDKLFIAKTPFLMKTKAKLLYKQGQYQPAIDVLNPPGILPGIDNLRPTQGDPNAGLMAGVYLDMLYYKALSYEALNEAALACDDWRDFQTTLQNTPPTTKPLWFVNEQIKAAEAVQTCDNNQ